MHKKDFSPLYCVHISRFHSAVTSNPKSFSPAATLDPRPRLWTPDRDIGPATATLDPEPRLWTRDRDFGLATRDPRLLVKLVRLVPLKYHFHDKTRQDKTRRFISLCSILHMIQIKLTKTNKHIYISKKIKIVASR